METLSSKKKDKAPHKKKLKYGCKLNYSKDEGLIASLGGRKDIEFIPTTTEPRVNYFETWRPKPGFCLEYDLSQSNFVVDSPDTKFILKDTTVSYVPSPNPPTKGKGNYSGNGLGPQWVFIDEKWREKQYAKQLKCLAMLKKRIHKKRRCESERERLITFNIICRNLRKNPRVKLRKIKFR